MEAENKKKTEDIKNQQKHEDTDQNLAKNLLFRKYNEAEQKFQTHVSEETEYISNTERIMKNSKPIISNNLILSEERLKVKSEELCNRNLILIEKNNYDEIDQIEVIEIQNSVLIDGDPSSWSQVTTESEKKRKKYKERTSEESKKQAVADVDKFKKRLEEVNISHIDPKSFSM